MSEEVFSSGAFRRLGSECCDRIGFIGERCNIGDQWLSKSGLSSFHTPMNYPSLNASKFIPENSLNWRECKTGFEKRRPLSFAERLLRKIVSVLAIYRKISMLRCNTTNFAVHQPTVQHEVLNVPYSVRSYELSRPDWLPTSSYLTVKKTIEIRKAKYDK